MYTVKEQDWKLFRKKLPLWQQAHMNMLNQEYIRILSREGLASDKFWELESASAQIREVSALWRI